METRQRLDSLAHDMKRKEQHIRDMQTRLDAPHQPGNSCEYFLFIINCNGSHLHFSTVQI